MPSLPLIPLQEDIARGDLRLYPHLTESHIAPTTWEKMNVKKAAQTLSYTIGDPDC